MGSEMCIRDRLEGDSTTLTCLVQAFPPVRINDILWKFKGLQIATSNELNLPNINPSASGEYECVVKNAIGTKTILYEVVVRCKSNAVFTS